MFQLDQRALTHNIWLWLPSGTSNSQGSPWKSVFAGSYWRECNERCRCCHVR